MMEDDGIGDAEFLLSKMIFDFDAVISQCEGYHQPIQGG